MKKSILSLTLFLCILITTASAVSASEYHRLTDTGEQTVSPDDTERNTMADVSDEAEPSDPADEDAEYESILEFVDSIPKLGSQYVLSAGISRAGKNVRKLGYKPDDQVTFIVVTGDKSLTDAGFSSEDISAGTNSVKDYETILKTNLESIQTQAEEKLSEDENYKKGWLFTKSTAGFSVKASYKNKSVLESLPGVVRVYIAPVYSIPEDGNLTTPVQGALTQSGAALPAVGDGELVDRGTIRGIE